MKFFSRTNQLRRTRGNSAGTVRAQRLQPSRRDGPMRRANAGLVKPALSRSGSVLFDVSETVAEKLAAFTPRLPVLCGKTAGSLTRPSCAIYNVHQLST